MAAEAHGHACAWLVAAREPEFASLGLQDSSRDDEALLDAMLVHRVLINRPIVISPLGVALCRPSERVLDLLPSPQRGAFAEEDGEQVLDADGNRLLR